MSYCSIDDVRSVGGMEDVEDWTDDQITLGIALADELIDTYTGTSFEAKAFTAVLDGTNSERLALRILFPQTVTAISVDGVDWIQDDLEGLVLWPDGWIEAADKLFTYTAPGHNVTVTGTAGNATSVPEEIKLAARIIAANFVVQLESRVPDRATAVQNEFGQVLIAQAAGGLKPTEFPVVNAILNRHRHKGPTVI